MSDWRTSSSRWTESSLLNFSTVHLRMANAARIRFCSPTTRVCFAIIPIFTSLHISCFDRIIPAVCLSVVCQIKSYSRYSHCSQCTLYMDLSLETLHNYIFWKRLAEKYKYHKNIQCRKQCRWHKFFALLSFCVAGVSRCASSLLAKRKRGQIFTCRELL